MPENCFLKAGYGIGVAWKCALVAYSTPEGDRGAVHMRPIEPLGVP